MYIEKEYGYLNGENKGKEVMDNDRYGDGR